MDFLAKKNLRITSQRQAIVDTVFSTDQHFTAEQLLEWSRLKDKSVSRATVYRTLPIMIESGLMREVDIGKSLKYYLPNNPEDSQQQAQVICVDCDKIFEVAAPFMEWYGSTVSARLGLSPVSQRLQVSATCNEFRRSGRCKNRKAAAR